MKFVKLSILLMALSFFIGHQLGQTQPNVSIVPVVQAQTPSSKANLISRYRAVSRQLLDVMALEQGLKTEYDALGFGDIITDADFTGANEGVTKTQFTSAVASFATIRATYATGHVTNLAKVAP